MSSGCTPAELQFEGDPLTHVKCLTHAETVAFFAATLSPIISLIALLLLLSIISRKAFRHQRPWPRMKPFEIYLLSLFAGDLIEAFGDTLNLRWIILGQVRSGDFCRAQGFIVTVGETAAALTTIAIAVHTFVLVWWGRGSTSLLVPCLVIGISWGFDLIFSSTLFATTHERREELFAPTPYWCWINLSISYKLLAFYLWAWLALLSSLVCYIPLFLLRWGHITKNNEEPWWKFHFHWRRMFEVNVNLHAFDMMLYPLVYSVVVLPLSGARWKQFKSKQWHNGSLTLAGAAIYDLTGLFNVLLFLYTREGLFFFRRQSSEDANGVDDIALEDIGKQDGAGAGDASTSAGADVLPSSEAANGVDDIGLEDIGNQDGAGASTSAGADVPSSGQ